MKKYYEEVTHAYGSQYKLASGKKTSPSRLVNAIPDSQKVIVNK